MNEGVLFALTLVSSIIGIFLVLIFIEEKQPLNYFILPILIPGCFIVWSTLYCNQEWEYEKTSYIRQVQIIDGQAIVVHNNEVLLLNAITNMNFEHGEKIVLKQQKDGPYLGIYSDSAKIVIERSN